MLEIAEWWTKNRLVQNAVCILTLASCISYVAETYLQGHCVEVMGVWTALNGDCPKQPMRHAVCVM